VALPVLDVELAVADVEVTDNGDETLIVQLVEALTERVEHRPLRFLAWGVNLARVHVAAHDREGSTVDVEVSFEPPARRLNVGLAFRGTKSHAVRDCGCSARDRNARASLDFAGVVQPVPAGLPQELL